jgi:hypothetical protein
MRFWTTLAVVIGFYATCYAAPPLPPAKQATDLSWVHSNTILYAIARPGIVAIPLDTAKPSVLVSGVAFGNEILLSPDKAWLLYGNQVTGYRVVDLKMHRQLDLSRILPANSLIQFSPDWSRLAWRNPQSGHVGIIDFPELSNAEYTLPTGLPPQETVINSIGWSYDGSRILVDSVSSATALRAVRVDPSDGTSDAEFGYAPSQASLTGAEFETSLKEQYWSLNPNTGSAEPVTGVFKPSANQNSYPRQFLHFFVKNKDIGTDCPFSLCDLCCVKQPLSDITLTNGAIISTDEFGGIYLAEPGGKVRLVQAPLPSSLRLPPMMREPTWLWAVLDDNYVLYAFNKQLWLYGVRENIKAPFPASFSKRFQF